MFGSIDGRAGNLFTSSRSSPINDCHLASASVRGRPADLSARVALASFVSNLVSRTIESAAPRYAHLFRHGSHARKGGALMGISGTDCAEVIVRRMETCAASAYSSL